MEAEQIPETVLWRGAVVALGLKVYLRGQEGEKTGRGLGPPGCYVSVLYFWEALCMCLSSHLLPTLRAFSHRQSGERTLEQA